MSDSGQFQAGSVCFHGDIARNYARGRSLSSKAATAWRDAILTQIPTHVSVVLDLGSGTGRFSGLLAEWLDAHVIAIEPSADMRNEALGSLVTATVSVRAGQAEQIDLASASIDVAWLGFMIHHVSDRRRCASELSRVVRNGGVILVAGAFPGKLDDITLFRFFPEAKLVADAYPSLDTIIADFALHNLLFSGFYSVKQQTAESLTALSHRTGLRADTTLLSISNEAFSKGQREIERLAGTTSGPIVDTLHLAVFHARAEI